MNRLSAVISSIDQYESLFMLELDASGITLEMLLFDLQPFFRTGSSVQVLFKETEVALAKGLAEETSFSNIFPAIITAIKKGRILAEISLQSKAGSMGSIITMKAAMRLGLQIHDEVTVLVKASQLSLEALP
ncbi:TOBE domain-containing protein [Chlorobium phaeobacteroides]|jgi:molybdopterin-binding protein|uniref:TOBE domain protein n=1 Tax=Chlorobium phaeobacteroides (strain DSM 266 / SMG 266 / 2430) TaxID=290317 RepID=A1BDM0_CHLPD|nr:TOBE domain-containing protein [Chlorobium phaeobacteroides]ABL64497.1 TOBE domain protein [Chlorobium phaeobacteroides DSM 266]MBV5326600.1 TOBE domain-containing protein [Chlorobium sp.]